MIVVKAGVVHEVFALESNSTWYCIHGASTTLTEKDLVEISDHSGNVVKG